ncbi:MAG: anaerobic ribonucleoside triphosphate reductase [Candidatus Spyradenecus sp.]
MIKTVIKRDGRQVPFNLAKIATAIVKALAQTRASEQLRDKDDFELEALANKLAEEATRKVTTETPDIEQIQDAVERVLMDNNLPDTAKSYILYRADRSRARERNTKLMRTLADIVHSSAKDSDVKRENANIDGDTAMGSMLKFGSESSKQFYIDNMLRPEVARAHEQGDIHIHDLDFYSLTMTCCQIDLVDLLSRGFSTGHGFLRAPKDIRSFAALACIAIQSNQNDQHGGQAVPNFDYAMAIGVRMTYARHYKAAMREAIELLCNPVLANDITLPEPPTMAQADDPAFTVQEAEALKAAGVAEAQIPHIQAFARAHALKDTDRDTYQAMEALVHNLNSMHSRAGAQTPFSSINYGTDTSLEGRMVMKNLLLTTQAGLGDGETPIFPIQIFRVKKGVNFDEGDPNYDLFKLACEVSAKRLFPNFAFQDAPFNAKLYREGHPETEISYMGCRTRIGDNVYDPDKSQVWKRGNLSFTSINLPRLAIQSHGSLKTFYAQLDDMLQLVRDQLLDRFEVQASKHVRNFPFLMGEGIWLDSEKLGPDDEVREVIKHGSLTFGFIGLAETLKSLIGKHHGESEEAQQLGLEIVKHMRDYADQCARETGLNFTLIATPAEGLSGRFVRMDKKRFGVIPEVTDRDYYTNSFHVPVYYPISAFRKIELEAPYHALTNGGHITYVELNGKMADNPEAFEKIVRHMALHGIGYGSVNHPLDRDPVCGYRGIIDDVCPKCGRHEDDGGPHFERIRRITGYLVGTLDRFNNAKAAEVRDRVKHL